MIGYSPQRYEYSFIKCSPEAIRDYSVIGTIVNDACLYLSCSFCIILDVITLCRIVYIRKVISLGLQDTHFQRDVRFFLQTAVQNVIMVAAATAIVLANNQHHVDNELIHIFGFNTLIFKHVNNGMALMIFNPEHINEEFWTVSSKPG
uniref:7TM_GPCR_Srx domain-containing protein n=1 Tax=Steinernema glaseri TaxID=37863 RepID=A0A1I8AMH9_9BILA